MMKRSKPRSTPGKTKSSYSSQDFKPKTTNVKQNLDKYLGLARESLTIGDRIAAEGYYQHAEHYLRLMNDIKAQQPLPDPTPSLSDTAEKPIVELSPESRATCETVAESSAA